MRAWKLQSWILPSFQKGKSPQFHLRFRHLIYRKQQQVCFKCLISSLYFILWSCFKLYFVHCFRNQVVSFVFFLYLLCCFLLEGLMSLLREMGKGYLALCSYNCKEAINILSHLPSHHYNTGWVLCQIGRAYFELSEYMQVSWKKKQLCLTL